MIRDPVVYRFYPNDYIIAKNKTYVKLTFCCGLPMINSKVTVEVIEEKKTTFYFLSDGTRETREEPEKTLHVESFYIECAHENPVFSTYRSVLSGIARFEIIGLAAEELLHDFFHAAYVKTRVPWMTQYFPEYMKTQLRPPEKKKSKKKT